MLRSRNIFLVGLMGAGKTTVGRALARRLGKRFLDSDHEIERRTGVKVQTIFEIERRTGVKVQTIFEIEGEPGFREREAQAIEALVSDLDIVLATGGGAVLSAANRRNLAEHGFVIYLRANPRDLWQRTRNDKSRPLLRTADPLARLEELYTVRDPLYRECADLVVDTGKQRVATLVAQILKLLPDECKLIA